MRNCWSKEEDSILLQCYGNKAIAEIERLLPNRGYNAIKSRANLLGLTTGKRQFWNESEDEILRQNYGSISVETLAELLPEHSETAIRLRANKLKIKAPLYYWKDEEIELIKSLYGVFPVKSIAKQLPGRTCEAIRGKARLMGLKGIDDDWTPEETEIIKQHYNKISNKNLVELIPGRTISGIHGKAVQLKLTNPALEFDKNFFSTPNILNSYWAGFIAADGCVYKEKNVVTIALSVKDYMWLEQLATDVNYNGSVKIYSKIKTSYGLLDCAKVAFCGAKQWVNDLNINFNVGSNKTVSLIAPTLSWENSLAYIVGFIDGDGSIYNTPAKSYPLVVSLVGTYEMMEWIKNAFYVIAPSSQAVTPPHRHKSIWSCSATGKRSKLILETLANASVRHLPRKWDKVKAIIR